MYIAFFRTEPTKYFVCQTVKKVKAECCFDRTEKLSNYDFLRINMLKIFNGF